MKKFVLGDIHGSHKGLLQVLKKSNFDYENDQLFFVGDVVDGWSQVDKCIEELMKIKNLIFLRGNHDQWAIDFYEQKMHKTLSSEYSSWMHHGGESTFNCYGEIMPKEHLDFLRSSIYYYELDDSIFVHGGFDFSYDIEKQMGYNFMWDRRLVQYAFDNQLKKRINEKYVNVYVGHTPLQSFNSIKFDPMTPQKWSGIWLMDTGCAFGGRLSLMDIETNEMFFSDRSMELYPDEKGRNKFTYNQMMSLNKKGE